MRRNVWPCIVLAFGILWTAAAAAGAPNGEASAAGANGEADGEDVVADLAAVRGIEAMKGPPAARAMLKRNGFVVLRKFYHRIFSPYLDQTEVPPFVTADSVHRTFHVIFEDQVEHVETTMAAEVADLTRRMRQALDRRLRDAAAGTEEHDALRLARDTFAVAEGLLAEDGPPGEPAPAAADELRLVREAAGVAESPLFGYDIDYARFTPRSFYTGSPVLRRYFRAMSWYGQAAFPLRSDVQTRAAMTIAHVFAADDDLRRRWRRIDRLYTHLVGPCDDLTPEEYAGLVRAMQRRRIKGDPLEWFRKHAGTLRDPRINSMVLPPAQVGQWRTLSKGMRFFGPRYLPDSHLFQTVTDPEVPGRLFPSGLDVMAACGSARARRHLEGRGALDAAAHADALRRGTERFRQVTSAVEPGHYDRFLQVLATLTAPPADHASAFARTGAYADKSLMTALGAWASMRHTWQLQAKASLTCFGGFAGSRIPGYVEPNPPFFEAMGRLVDDTIAVLGGIEGVEVNRLRKFGRLIDRLHAMARRQRDGEPLTRDDAALLKSYPTLLAELQGFLIYYYDDEALPHMGLVADVHTEAWQERKVLQVASGGAMPIYAVVDTPIGPQLVVGAVYSYSEFLRPLADRLTDEAWRRACEAGRAPSLPAWTDSFVTGLSAEALIARARRGEYLPELLSAAGPEVDAFLASCLEPGTEMLGKENCRWALETAARRLGRRTVPPLMEMVRQGPLWLAETKAGYQYLDGRAVDAAAALAEVAGPDEIAALEALAFGDDPLRAELACHAAAWCGGKEAEGLLVDVVRRQTEGRVLRKAWEHLIDRVSWDIAADLFRQWDRPGYPGKDQILYALARLWNDPYGHQGGVFPAGASPAEIERLRKRFKDLVLGLNGLGPRPIDDVDPDVASNAWYVAVDLKLPEMVDDVRRRLDRGESLEPKDYNALEDIGTPLAVETLLGLSRSEDATVRLEAALALTPFLENPAVRKRLLELLEDRTPARRDPRDALFLSGPADDESPWTVQQHVAHTLLHRTGDILDANALNECPTAREVRAVLEWLRAYARRKQHPPTLEYRHARFPFEDKSEDYWQQPFEYPSEAKERSGASPSLREQQEELAEQWKQLMAEEKARQTEREEDAEAQEKHPPPAEPGGD